MRLQSLRHVSEQSVKIPSLPASPVTPPMLSEDAGKSLSTKVPESWTKETGLVFIRLGIPQNGWFMIKPLKWKILPPRPPHLWKPSNVSPSVTVVKHYPTGGKKTWSADVTRDPLLPPKKTHKDTHIMTLTSQIIFAISFQGSIIQ